jgi:hypothetical protein
MPQRGAVRTANRFSAASSWPKMRTFADGNSGVSGRAMRPASTGTSGAYLRARRTAFGPLVWMTPSPARRSRLSRFRPYRFRSRVRFPPDESVRRMPSGSVVVRWLPRGVNAHGQDLAWHGHPAIEQVLRNLSGNALPLNPSALGLSTLGSPLPTNEYNM